MTLTFVAIWIFMLALGLSAVWALAWALVGGQFRNLRSSGRSIFDADEPVGQPTDRFPPA